MNVRRRPFRKLWQQLVLSTYQRPPVSTPLAVFNADALLDTTTFNLPLAVSNSSPPLTPRSRVERLTGDMSPNTVATATSVEPHASVQYQKFRVSVWTLAKQFASGV